MPAMVPLDALAAYLRQQDPNRDWTATLAGFGQIGGMPAIPTPNPEVLATVNPLTIVPTSSARTSEKSSPTATALLESTIPSPKHPQIEPIDAIPLSSYQDPYMGETEERKTEEKGGEAEGSEKGGDKSEETPVTNTIPQEEEKGEIDLNETAKKQGLMTDDEFQSILDGVHRREESAKEMAEGLDLASQAVGEGDHSGVEKESENVAHQPVEESKEDEDEDKYLQERKQKGKNPAKKKQVAKKQRSASTSIVIREPEQRRGISD